MTAAAQLLAADEPSPVLVHPHDTDRAAWAARGGPFLLSPDSGAQPGMRIK